MSSFVHILYLEGDPAATDRVTTLLSNTVDCNIDHVSTPERFVTDLDARAHDLILIGDTPPCPDVRAVLVAAAEIAPRTPAIVVASTLHDGTIVDCFKRGAVNFVLRAHLDRLVPAVREALADAARGENLRVFSEARETHAQRCVDITSNLPGGVYQFIRHPDGSYAIPYAGARFSELTGVETSKVVADINFAFSHVVPEDAASLIHASEVSAATMTRLEHDIRVKKPGYETVWLRACSTPVKLEDGSFLWSGILLDVTAHKNAEAALQAERNFNVAVLSTVGALVIVLDNRGAIISFNQACEKATGYQAAKVTGRKFWDFLATAPETEATKKRFETPQADDFPNAYESFWVSKNGSLRRIAWSNTCLTNPDGKVDYVICTGLDVTEQRQAEAELAKHQEHLEELVEARTAQLQESEVRLRRAKEEAEKASRAKSEFLSRMSHELRTPLNAVLGFAQLMESDPMHPLAQPQQENVGQIVRAGWHLLELINEVLDLSRIEAGRLALSLEDVPLGTMFEDCRSMIAPLADKRRITIEFPSGNREAPIVRADWTRLRQVLLNLLSNAIKYNVDGGSVTVGFGRPEAGKVRISVTDTGPGIPKEKLDELFMAFNRLGAEKSGVDGTGIGLVIAKRMTELMHGTIGVDSDVGRGSTFWIELPHSTNVPVSREELHETVAAATAGLPGELPSRCVLYIEDNPANLRLVEQALGRMPNVRVVSACEPMLGMELAASERPDLILLDIDLPGVDGYQVFSWLKALDATRETPVLAISANAMQDQVEKGQSCGFVDYLTKPIEVPHLIHLVSNLLYISGENEQPPRQSDAIAH